MVELGEAGSHFSASRSRCGDDDKRLGGFDIVVLSIALVAYDVGDVVRVSVDRIMTVYFDAKMLKLCLKDICGRLSGVAGDNNAADIQTLVAVFLDQTENICIVGDAKVVANLVFLNICGIDRDDDLGLVR